MRTPMSTLLVATVIILGRSDLGAQPKPLCEGLTGDARTKCLNQEAARTAAEARKANEHFERLNKRMVSACNAAAVMDNTAKAASAAGEVTQFKPLKYGGRTWTSVRDISKAVTKERRNCDDARRALASAQRR